MGYLFRPIPQYRQRESVQDTLRDGPPSKTILMASLSLLRSESESHQANERRNPGNRIGSRYRHRSPIRGNLPPTRASVILAIRIPGTDSTSILRYRRENSPRRPSKLHGRAEVQTRAQFFCHRSVWTTRAQSPAMPKIPTSQAGEWLIRRGDSFRKRRP